MYHNKIGGLCDFRWTGNYVCEEVYWNEQQKLLGGDYWAWYFYAEQFI
jgi:hypothetical protein